MRKPWTATRTRHGRVPKYARHETLNAVPNRRNEVVVATKHGLVYAYWSEAGMQGRPHVCMQMVYKGRLFKGQRYQTSANEATISRTDYIHQWAESIARSWAAAHDTGPTPPDEALLGENITLRRVLSELVEVMREWMRGAEMRGMGSWPTPESLPRPLREAMELTGEGEVQ